MWMRFSLRTGGADYADAPNAVGTFPGILRSNVFNVLFSQLGDFEGKSFLDLFGGSGIMGLEAFSRGFEAVITLL